MSAETLDLISEGCAKAYLPKGVFYNPVQEFNRDLTITVISEYGELVRQEQAVKRRNKVLKAEHIDEAFSETGETAPIAGKVYPNGLKILEGLAASGLRSVRFCMEIPGVRQVTANDYSLDAVATMKQNIELNNVEELMTASCDDAAMLMYTAARKPKMAGLFDVIDLDPYGGPTPFLDGAVQAVKNGGLLCVTCTDMAILCGNASEKCFAAYGAMSLKSKNCHEMALRIVLRTIDSYANRYAKYIEPLLSVSVDFYCRVFVRVYNGAQKVKESASKSAMVYECSGCSASHLQPLGRMLTRDPVDVEQRDDIKKKFTFSTGPTVDRLCQFCGKPHHIGGPIWSAPIHNMDFVDKLKLRAERSAPKLGTSKRILGMMSLVSEELPDVPLYYSPERMCGVIHATSPGLKVICSAILHTGYRVSLSHAATNSVKTDAPVSVLWDILRCWVKLHPVNEKRLIEGTPCANILSQEPQLEANFQIHEDAEPESRRLGLLRFQTGMKDWGPKARASNAEGPDQNAKRKQNQNKRGEKKKRKTEPLKTHYCATLRRTGKCSYGDDCRYRHDIPDSTEQRGAAASGDSDECGAVCNDGQGDNSIVDNDGQGDYSIASIGDT